MMRLYILCLVSVQAVTSSSISRAEDTIQQVAVSASGEAMQAEVGSEYHRNQRRDHHDHHEHHGRKAASLLEEEDQEDSRGRGRKRVYEDEEDMDADVEYRSRGKQWRGRRMEEDMDGEDYDDMRHGSRQHYRDDYEERSSPSRYREEEDDREEEDYAPSRGRRSDAYSEESRRVYDEDVHPHSSYDDDDEVSDAFQPAMKDRGHATSESDDDDKNSLESQLDELKQLKAISEAASNFPAPEQAALLEEDAEVDINATETISDAAFYKLRGELEDLQIQVAKKKQQLQRYRPTSYWARFTTWLR